MRRKILFSSFVMMSSEKCISKPGLDWSKLTILKDFKELKRFQGILMYSEEYFYSS